MRNLLTNPAFQGFVIWVEVLVICSVIIYKIGEPQQMVVHESIENGTLVRIK